MDLVGKTIVIKSLIWPEEKEAMERIAEWDREVPTVKIKPVSSAELAAEYWQQRRDG